MDTTNDWAAARSEKWRRHLAGLEAMLAPLDPPLIAALELTTAVRIADIGCGSGATTMAAFRRAPAGSVVHGFDLSPALVDVAHVRDGRHESLVEFRVADMGIETSPPLGYDRLISRLGVMFFSDPPSAFGNLRRWLVPGGRFAFAVWGPVADNTWLAATRAAVADAIDLPPIDMAAPGPFRYAESDRLVALLTGAGFTDVAVSDWRPRLPIGDRLPAPDAARFALASFSSFAELLSGCGPDAEARAQHSLTARFAPYEETGAVLMPARVHIVTGRTARVAGARS